MSRDRKDAGLAGRAVVGAIRWDAWQDDDRVNAEVERTLGPEKWHGRVPFFGRVTGAGTVSIRGNSPSVMDREIAYAADAGLDYWAFVTYPLARSMSNGLKLYLASPLKDRIRFCLNLQGGWLSNVPWEEWAGRLIEHFRDACYQKVLGGRPLVYLFQAEKMLGADKPLPTWTEAKDAFDRLRAASVAAGGGSPYLVVQGWNTSKDKQVMLDLGADAIGAYAVAGGSAEGMPYSALAGKAAARWDDAKNASVPVAPLASAGWDRRPRYDAGGVSWEKGPGSNLHFLPPAPAELAAHVHGAIEWVRANPAAAPAGAVLIYAWNENDEGGWLTPTLRADGSIDASRLDALAPVLRRSDKGAKEPPC